MSEIKGSGSVLKEVQIQYTWIIPNFKEHVHQLSSPLFGEQWCIVLKPNDGNHLSIYLKLQSSKVSTVMAKCKFCVINQQDVQKFTVEFANPVEFSPGKTYGFPQFLNRGWVFQPKSLLLNDGGLTVNCIVTVYEKNVVPAQTRKCLCDDLLSLLDEQKLTDVEFSVGGKTIKAHKVILAARSHVFARMFDTPTFDSAIGGVIDIAGVTFNDLQNVIRYIYTGKCEDVENSAESLILAADKYGLEKLKTLCEATIVTKLAKKNAVQLLILADTSNALVLKNAALSVINSHAAEIMDSIEWKDMVQEHSHLVSEIFRFVVGRGDKNK